MSNFCTDCGELKLSGHRCPPVFNVRFADVKSYGEDWSEQRGQDAEDAAANFAEGCDRGGDYDILQSGGGPDYVVEVQDGDTVRRFEITAESVAHYYANEE